MRSRTERFVSFLSLATLLSCSTLSFAAGPSPKEILEKADEIRNPSNAYRMQVKVENTSQEAKESSDGPAAFEVMIQGKDKTLVRTLKPMRDRGRNLLMLGEEMWAYLPNLKRSVRVSLSQRLTGQAANGDISRMRWSGDYDATLEAEDAKSWTLFLAANRKGLTYDKIRIWIEKGNFHPVKAEYLTLSGKTLKRATYQDYKMMEGKVRPTEILIQDAVRENDQSKIKIIKMENKKLPESLFQQNNLGRTE